MRLIATSLSVLLLALPLAAQQWQRLPSTAHPPKDAFVAMAYDAHRDRVVCVADQVIFDSGPPYYVITSELTTWEWDGAHWMQRVTATAPPSPSSQYSIAYDPARQRVVFVSRIGETWSFDGADWQQEPIAGVTGYGTSLAFDPVRGVLVMAAGQDPASHGIYEVMNGAWTLRASLAPAWRSTEVGFDPISARVVAFGGTNLGSGALDVSTTWAWDGNSITTLAPATVPPGRCDHVLVNDPSTGLLLLVGGGSLQPAAAMADVYLWAGNDWLPQPSLPSPRVKAAAAPLGGSVALFGGRSSWSGGMSHEVVNRDATGAWATVPMPASGTRAAHDTLRQRTVSVRNGATVEFDGYRWIDLGIMFPGAASIAAMAFHAQTARTVAFDDAGATWLFDGLTWTQATTPVAPPPRTLPGMGYDPVRNVVVMYGGVSGNTHRNDVWEWNGASWTNPLPTSPATAGAAAIAWDGQSLHVIVTPSFGYWTTWTWNGAAFTFVVNCSLFTNQTTAPRLAHDPALGLVAIVRAAAIPQDLVFRLVGGLWQLLWPGTFMPPCDGALVVDGNRGQIVLHDGANERDLILSSQAASAQPYGASCSGTSRLPRLTAPVAPQLGAGSVSDVDRATPGTFVFLLADLVQANAALPGGCTALLQNPIVLAAAPTNGTGFATTGVAVPAAPSLRGIDLFEQALVLDPAGALFGFANLTNGLRLRIGD